MLIARITAVISDDPMSYRIASTLPRPNMYHMRQQPSRSVRNDSSREQHTVVVKLNVDALHDVFTTKRAEERFSPSGVSRLENKLHSIAEGHGFHYIRSISGLPYHYLFVRDMSLRDVSHGMNESVDIEWFDDVSMPPPRIKRDVLNQQQSSPQRDLNIDDPLWSRQWYLADSDQLSIGNGQVRPGHPLNINVFPVWQSGITGSGVNIAIVDDGLERRHPDLRRNYQSDLSYDVNNNDVDPTPVWDNYHGTACAGVACAVGMNGEGLVGVAYNARVAGIKVLEKRASDADEAEALSLACTTQGYVNHHSRFVNNSRSDVSREAQQRITQALVSQGRSGHSNVMNHIFSCSWGPTDDGKHLDGPGRLVKETYQYCTQQGRNGLGSIYIVAGGNGRDYYDSSNYDGYANADETIAVAAVTDYGSFAWYSESGANLLCALPSSGNGQRAIIAPDLTEDAGVSPGDYTQSFGGTSADAPMLAGIVALMLEANPSLTWRDVQHVLIRSCRIANSRTTVWSLNAAGRSHSMDYGFGVPDVSRAVSLAQQWGGSGTMGEGSEVRGPRIRAFSGKMFPSNHHVSSWTIDNGHTITLEWDYNEASQQRNVLFTAREGRTTRGIENGHQKLTERSHGIVLRIEHVRVNIDADTPMGHGYLGLTLCGPSGVCSPLSQLGRGEDHTVSWSYSTLRHWDEYIVYNPSLDQRPPDIRSHVAPTDSSRFGVWTLRVGNMFSYRSQPIVVRSWSIEFHGTAQQH
jgi:subtilisin family serine protease